MININDVLSKLSNVQNLGNGDYKACCPAHNDKNPSLSVKEENGKVLLHCFAGCSYDGIIKALGLDTMVLPGAGKTIERIYDYRFANGSPNMQVVRYYPKTFKQRKNESDWKIKNNGVEITPYRLEKWHNTSDPVFIVEGEKDVENLESIGLVGTCNAGGAEKWRDKHSTFLKNRTCYIVPDKDKPGEKHGKLVAMSLQGSAKEIKIINLPDLPSKDISDFIEARRKAGKTDIEIKTEIESITTSTAVYVPEVILKASETTATETEKIKARFFEIQNDKLIDNKNAAMAKTVLEFLLKRGTLYYNSELKTFDSSMYFDNEKHILLKIDSDEFQSFLSAFTGINRSDNCYKYFNSEIQTASLDNKYSKGIIPAKFWKEKDKCFYLSKGDGHIVKISAGKYEVCSNGVDGVLFEAGYTLKDWEMTTPVNPFETCSLFKNASYASDNAFMLLQLYAISLPSNPSNKPPLILTSPVGGGKTRTARGLCELFGIPESVIKISNDSEKDFWVNMHNGGILICDNVDTNISWYADTISTASTGGGQKVRGLYTDNDINFRKPNAWTITTSANPMFASDAGLADRTLLIRLKRREGETSDNELSEEIAVNRNPGMSFICDTLAKALADTNPVKKGLNKRHPDFANLAVKIGRALEKETEAIQALKTAELDKSKFNLENDELGEVILSYMENNDTLEGTTAEIMQALKSHDIEFDTPTAKNPKGYWIPKRAGKRIAKLEPHLNELFVFHKSISAGTNKYMIMQKTKEKPEVIKPLETVKPEEVKPISDSLPIIKGSYPLNDGLCKICGYKQEHKYQVECPFCIKSNLEVKAS